MVKRLVKQGNSWGLVIEKTLLDLIGLTAAIKEVEISTDGRSIMLTPVISKPPPKPEQWDHFDSVAKVVATASTGQPKRKKQRAAGGV